MAMESPDKSKTIDYTWYPTSSSINTRTIIAEYVWIDGDGGLRSKIKIFPSKSTDPKGYLTITLDTFPEWNFDGSSTGQSETRKSDLVLRPVYFCFSPFNKTDGSIQFLVLCEVVGLLKQASFAGAVPLQSDHPSNHYRELLPIYEATKDAGAWFGIEQEYILLDKNGELLDKQLINTSHQDYNPNQHYCSVGTGRALGRQIALEHMRCCISAGLGICGINSEVTPSQWEFQIGPGGHQPTWNPSASMDAMTVSHQLWLARYILIQVAERHNAIVSFHPKPFAHLNGSGAHTNFSTAEMRAPGGITAIHTAILKLSQKHPDHIAVYGKHNELRLTGTNETANIETFSYGNCDRGSSIRIPVNVAAAGCGYLEDRRPAANCDPYQVCRMLLATIVSDGRTMGEHCNL